MQVIYKNMQLKIIYILGGGKGIGNKSIVDINVCKCSKKNNITMIR